MSPAPAVTQPPAVVLRNTARRGSYLEQLLAEHTPAFPAPAAPCPPPVGTARGQGHRPVERPPALMTSPDVRTADGATAAAAGALTQARPRIDDDTETAPPLPRDPMDWAAFGTVIPVLAGHTGGGASVLAAVLADALAARGHRVLLIDAADPLRSGLADATTDDGPSRPSPHGSVRVRQARRGPIRCARLEFDDIPVRSPALVPAPQYWVSPDGPVDVTVIDIGWDAWGALGATALQGPGGWLRCGSPTPRPVLAMRPSLPAARHTEQLLNRLAHWDHDGGAADIAAVAVIGAKKVPPALRAAAGDALTPLLASAVCLPDDRRLAERGITADPTPAAAQHAVQPLLTRWGLLTTTTTPPVPRRSLLRRKPLPQEGLPS